MTYKINYRRLTLLFAFVTMSASLWSQRQPPALTRLFAKPTPSALRIAEHNDHPNTCLNLEWNIGTADWDSSALDSYLYYPNGDLAQMTVSLYTNSAWEDWHKGVFAYDNSHHQTSAYFLEWSGSSWDSIERYDNTWDSQGNLTLDLFYTYNGVSWDTASGDRYTYTYHSGSLIATQISEHYSSSSHAWWPEERWSYHYNAQNQWDSLTFAYDNAGQWEPYERLIDVEFHDFSKELFASYRYQQNTGAWTDVGRVAYTYGPFEGYVALSEAYSVSWDSTGKEVVNKDAEDHVTLEEAYGYSNGWTFQDGDIYDYTYDGLGRTTEMMQAYTVNTVYQNGSKRIYDSFFTVGMPNTAIASFEVQTWPNPVTDAVHILPHLDQPTTALLSLYDLQGSLHWQQSARLSHAELQLRLPDGLENGSYLLELDCKAGRFVTKLVLMR